MSLSEFFASLTNGAIVVTVLENDGTELVKIYANGYQQLLATLLERAVAEVTINSNVLVSVKLAATDSSEVEEGTGE